MRHALVILKYIPAVLCGLLVVAWVVSLLYSIRLDVTFPGAVGTSHLGLEFDEGSVDFTAQAECGFQPWDHLVAVTRKPALTRPLGEFRFTAYQNKSPIFVEGRHAVLLTSPVSLILAGFIPLALVPLTRFRFPLWSYFAWTALLAAELAYYLRA